MPPTHTAPLLQDSAGEPLYKLFKAIKHQVEKGPVDAVQKKAKYTLNDTGLLGDDVEYAPLVSPPEPEAAERKVEPGTWTPHLNSHRVKPNCPGKGFCDAEVQSQGSSLNWSFPSCVPLQTVSVIVQDEGIDAIPVKVLNCDTISQVKEKIIDQVYRTQPCSCWPKPDSVVLGEFHLFMRRRVPSCALGWAERGPEFQKLSYAFLICRMASWVHRPDSV